jgi:hypothetical protein
MTALWTKGPPGGRTEAFSELIVAIMRGVGGDAGRNCI